jgi:multiple sugar transport system ATP-binding protein
MRTEISKLHTQLETTMIYVTHDQVEAMTMGDRICVMKDGLIQQIADPLTLYDKPVNLFVAGFIGTPPMNFFHGDLSVNGDDLIFKEDNFEVILPTSWKQSVTPYVGKNVTFGIRPEDIGSEQATDKGFPSIKAVIEVVEPMGAETYLYLNTGKHPFIARVDAHLQFKVGESVELPLYMPKAHMFDGETTNIIL